MVQNKMYEIFNQIKKLSPLRKTLGQTCKRNGLNISFITQYSVLRVKRIMKKLQHKIKANIIGLHCDWYENQVKLFHLTLVLFSHIYKVDIKNFNDQQWNEIQKLFGNKDIFIIKYQALKFLNNKNNVKNAWTHQQDQLLKKIVQQSQQGQNNLQRSWNKIAVNLSNISQNQFFKTKKQCKQRWYNHLNPQIKHGQWTKDQDKIIITNILSIGKKWLDISRQFNGTRTQHMIKNRKNKPYILQQQSIIKQLSKQLDINQQSNQIPNLPLDKLKQQHKKQQSFVKIEEDLNKSHTCIKYQQNNIYQPLPLYQLNLCEYIYYPTLYQNIFPFQ